MGYGQPRNGYDWHRRRKLSDKYRIFSAAVERLHTGSRWAEGPVWFGDGRYLLWSDIPNNRMLKWEEETGAVSVYRHSTDFPNGNTRDRQGRLVTCQHGGRRAQLLPAMRRVGRAVRDQLQGAPPFEDGAFQVALTGTLAVGVDRWDLAVQGDWNSHINHRQHIG